MITCLLTELSKLSCLTINIENMVTVSDVLDAREKELKEEMQTLEMAYDDNMCAGVEYTYRKQDLNCKVEEVSAMRCKMKSAGLITDDEGHEGHLIGSNGTIKLWIRHGVDCRLWVETNGVRTVEVVEPKVSDVDKWKLIIGIE